MVSFNKAYTMILILDGDFGKCLSVTPTPSGFFWLPHRHATWLHGIGVSFDMAAKKRLNSEVRKSSCDFGFNAQYVTRWMQEIISSCSFLLRWSIER